MMETLRKYLISLRKFDNEGLFGNMTIFLLIISIIGILLGFTFDILLPINFFLNMLRGVVAIISGIALFSFGYLYTSKRSVERRRHDRYYQTVRERFSYRQRVNFSIALGSIASLFVLLGKPSSPLFTFKAILLISIAFTLIAFSRRLREEFIKDIHEIPDLRDLEKAAKLKRKKKEKADV